MQITEKNQVQAVPNASTSNLCKQSTGAWKSFIFLFHSEIRIYLPIIKLHSWIWYSWTENTKNINKYKWANKHFHSNCLAIGISIGSRVCAFVSIGCASFPNARTYASRGAFALFNWMAIISTRRNYDVCDFHVFNKKKICFSICFSFFSEFFNVQINTFGVFNVILFVCKFVIFSFHETFGALSKTKKKRNKSLAQKSKQFGSGNGGPATRILCIKYR